MSSSGLIYAFIVGAWAVYLVPMWLRREDELNKARQTQRYTTAIKVLSHKDSFERRYGATGEQARDEDQARALPLAVGQSGSAPAAGQQTLDRVKAKDRERAVSGALSAGGSASASGARVAAGSSAGAAVGSAAGPAAKSKPRARAAFAAEPAASSTARRATVSARVDSAADAAASGSARSARSSATSGNSAIPTTPGVWTPPPPAQSPSATSSAGLGPRSGLRARRRRVVGFLFALTSLGAIISADLGMAYVWVMLMPAAALSAYIVWVRKDERARAAERARRRAVAVKVAREAERRDSELRREQDEVERLEREELARRSAMARRRTAAARSRAERRTTPGLPDQGDLPRAANS
jgi:hypothetical protein